MSKKSKRPADYRQDSVVVAPDGTRYLVTMDRASVVVEAQDPVRELVGLHLNAVFARLDERWGKGNYGFWDANDTRKANALQELVTLSEELGLYDEFN